MDAPTCARRALHSGMTSGSDHEYSGGSCIGETSIFCCSSASGVPVNIVASQGWKLQPEGAHLALSMTRCSSSNGTVLGVNARTERRESTAWLTVNWFMRGQLPIKGRLVKPKSFYLLHKNLTCGDMHLHDRMSFTHCRDKLVEFPDNNHSFNPRQSKHISSANNAGNRHCLSCSAGS